MMMRLTDRKAIDMALNIAIEWEKSLADAHRARYHTTEDGQYVEENHPDNIKIIEQYFGPGAKPLDFKIVSIQELMAIPAPQKFKPPTGSKE